MSHTHREVPPAVTASPPANSCKSSNGHLGASDHIARVCDKRADVFQNVNSAVCTLDSWPPQTNVTAKAASRCHLQQATIMVISMSLFSRQSGHSSQGVCSPCAAAHSEAYQLRCLDSSTQHTLLQYQLDSECT